jgi:hypothetical protein
MDKIIKYIKEHWRAVAFVTGLLGCLTLLIGGIGWTDYAESKFWQAAWVISAGLGLVGFIGGIYWLVNNWKKLKE